MVYLEEPIRLLSPYRTNFSFHPFIRLEYENTQILNVGIKIRVPTWSFLCIVHPLQTPIPMCEKKIRIQQENSQKITNCLRILPTKFLHYVPYTRGALTGWRNFSKTAEKSSSSPRAAGVRSSLASNLSPRAIYPSRSISQHGGGHQKNAVATQT